MPDGFDLDFTEVYELAHQLGDVAQNAGHYIKDAQDESSLAIKERWAESVSGFPRAKHFHRSISYDWLSFQGFGATVLTTEIGPDKGRRQGALGNLIEYGSVKNAPGQQGAAALKAEEAAFEKALDAALGRALAVVAADNSFVGSLMAGLRGRY